MRYRIEYLRDGASLGTEMSVGTLEATKQAARVGMVERRADFAYVIDEATGTEVWSETKKPAR